MRRLFPAILLVSAAAIGYEILLMRVLSIVQWHHFAYMIISLALLGYGASGTFIAIFRPYLESRFVAAFSSSALLFSISMLACYLVAQRVPFNALEIVWDRGQLLELTLIYIILFVPFFFAACCIGLAFTCRPKHAGRIYFFDLLGAGIGAATVIGLLYVLHPVGALLVLVVGAALAAFLAAFAYAANSPHLLAPVAWLVLVFAALPETWLVTRVSEFKGLPQALEVIDAKVVHESSSPLGQLTVVESPTIPFRHAPGLSFATAHVPPEQLAVFTDGDALSVINRFDGNLDKLGYLGDVTAALPYRLLDSPEVLVLGAGGASDVLLALYNGAHHVDAVELNPQVTRLVLDRYAGFAGHLYEDRRVTVHTREARGYVAQSNFRYDLIQIGLLDSFGASGSGVQSLHESYLYTVEALQQYLLRLEPDGVLAITRWLKIPPRDSIKLFGTAVEALRQNGVTDPGQQLAMIRSWNTTTLLVRNGRFKASDVDIIRDFAASKSFDTIFFPGMTSANANRYNLLDEAWLHNAAVALLGDTASSYVDDYKFQIEPATDDRPYFFHFFKWESFLEAAALRKRGGAGLIEWGYVILVATLAQAALVAFLLIVLPLMRVRRDWAPGIGLRMGSYFGLLGLAFLFVEIAFIQKFILFLSHPLYAVAVVLSSFLVFAGFGSALSDRLRQRSPAVLAVSLIVVLSAAYIILLPAVFSVFIGAADLIRIAVSVALIAPLALFMGMPFPLGLRQLADQAPGFIPWAWGINGFASVISAALATVLAIEFGFTAVLGLALLMYASSAALLYR